MTGKAREGARRECSGRPGLVPFPGRDTQCSSVEGATEVLSMAKRVRAWANSGAAAIRQLFIIISS